MANRFLVLTEFKAKDGMSSTVARMNTGFSRFAMNITDKSSLIGAGFAKMNTAINRVAKVGLAALAVGLTAATVQFVQLDKSITAAGAKFSDVDSTNVTSFKKSLDSLSASARSVGADTEFSAVDAAGALDKFAMAGFTAKQSMSILRGTTDLATAADTDLTTAVDIATDSLGAFNLNTEDAAQLQKNLTRVSDVMAKTTVTANTSLTDMFEAVKIGAPAFTAAGQSAETFSALVGTLANAGIKGTEAGTNIRNIMLRLASPTGDAAKLIDFLGIKVKDSSGNFLDTIDIIGQFQNALDGMGTQQKSAVLQTIFGQRAITGFNVLLNAGADDLDKYRNELVNSSGAAAQMANAIRGSLSNQIEILKSSLTELGLKFVDAFAGEGQDGLQKLISLVQNFDVTPFVAFGKIAITVLGFLAAHIKTILSFAAGIKAVAIAIQIATIAQKLFNIAISASTMGKLITIVFLLITAITFLVTHWSQVVAVMKKVWAFIKSSFIIAINALKSAWETVITALKEFGSFLLTVLISAFKKVVLVMKVVGQTILKYLLTPVNLVLSGIINLLNLLSKLPGIGDKLGDVAATIKKIKDQANITFTGSAGTFDYGTTLGQLSGVQTPTPSTENTNTENNNTYGRTDIYIHEPKNQNVTAKTSRQATGIAVKIAPSLQ